MSSIADWLASLPSEGGMASDATLVAKGAELYKSKICHTCHGADAQTPIAPSYPKLSGQNPAYAVAQMTDIKSGARENVQTAGMKGIMGMVNEDDMKAIAQWLASTP
ncbi:MAG: cytochrome c [Candidatus Parabeggiatoa sp. nov. 1]|nr:MAG: cytochrome c [Gammaproteobacteria bacterium]